MVIVRQSNLRNENFGIANQELLPSELPAFLCSFFARRLGTLSLADLDVKDGDDVTAT